MQMNRESGASEQEVAELEKRLKLSLPDSYKSILRFTNGAAGRIGSQEFLLYSIDEALDANSKLQAFTEGLVIFGSNGGDEAYVFDPANNWYIGMSPWIPMGRRELVPVSRTLNEFFTVLRNRKNLGGG